MRFITHKGSDLQSIKTNLVSYKTYQALNSIPLTGFVRLCKILANSVNQRPEQYFLRWNGQFSTDTLNFH